MAQLLKVEEWQGGSGNWYVADTHTWTGWRAIAEDLDVDFDGLIDLLINKYHAIFFRTTKESLLYYFPKYKDAHQFKLDVNRIARHKQLMVERQL